MVWRAQKVMSIDRKFLHDISSPLTSLRIHLEILAEEAKTSGADNLESLQKCQKLLDKCIKQIQEQKNILVAEDSNGKAS